MTQLSNSQDYDFNNDMYQQIDAEYHMRRKALKKRKTLKKKKSLFQDQNDFACLLIGTELEDALDTMIASWRI